MKKWLIALLWLTACSAPALAATAEQICDRYSDALDPQRPKGLPVVYYHPVETSQAGVDACLQVLKQRPDDPRILYQTGNAYFPLMTAALADVLEYDTSTDMRTLRNLLNQGLSPGQFPSHNSDPKAVARLESLKQQAFQHYSRAAARGYLAARYKMALAHLSAGDNKTSKKEFDAMLRTAPALAHNGLYNWYWQQASNSNDDAQAERHRERAIHHLELAHKHGHPYAIASQIAIRNRRDREPLDPKILQSLNHNNPHLLGAVAAARYHAGDKVTANQLLAELRQRSKRDKDFRTAALYVEAVMQDSPQTYAEARRRFLAADRAGHPSARETRMQLLIHQKVEEAP